jgi:hypothetical protein
MNSNTGGSVLRIGFSFGVRPDGTPGESNRQLAKFIHDALTPDRGCAIGVQWELADAMVDLFPSATPTPTFVAPPFTTIMPEQRERWDEDRKRREKGRLQRFQRYLETAAAEPLRCFGGLQLLGTVLLPAPSWFGAGCIDDAVRWLYDKSMNRWYERFVTAVDFQDLLRSEKGLLGLEKRRMPDPADYPDGLREWQTQRVNRLILESLVPAWVLPRAEYLNTERVAKHVFDALSDPPAAVVIYAHPDHYHWCKSNTEKAFRAVFKSSQLKIEQGAPLQRWPDSSLWDPLSAQVWTRSRENYLIYNDL